jgi:DNA repair protein RecO (recombination protein O)
MKTFKARGIVLKEYEAGESDKRLVLLCKEHGRLTVYAKGARKPKSKFLAAAQLFTYADFVLASGRQFLSVTQADVIQSFYAVRADYDRLCHAHLLTEICEKTILEDISCDALLLLLLKSLMHLNKPAGLPHAQIAAVFLFRFFMCYGITPQARVCCVCNADLTADLYFCAEGLACKACAAATPHRIPIESAAAAALRYILESDLPASFMFKTTDAILQRLNQASRLYWRSHFDWKLKSEAFIGC